MNPTRNASEPAAAKYGSMSAFRQFWIKRSITSEQPAGSVKSFMFCNYSHFTRLAQTMKTPPEDDANLLKKEPIQGRSQRTINTILQTAAQFIERDQEDEFTTNHIAKKAGFSIGTLYQYFPNKEAIILALARRATERVMQEISQSNEQDIAAGKDVREILLGNTHKMVDMFGRGPLKKRWLSRMVWRLESHAITAEFTEQSARNMAQLLARANDPRLRMPSALQLFVVTRAMQGVIRSVALEDTQLLDDPDFEEELVNMVWNMLLIAPKK